MGNILVSPFCGKVENLEEPTPELLVDFALPLANAFSNYIEIPSGEIFF